MPRVEFKNGGVVTVEEEKREPNAPFALELQKHGTGFRVVYLTDVDLAMLAIELANIPCVKKIIAGAVELDKRNRPTEVR